MHAIYQEGIAAVIAAYERALATGRRNMNSMSLATVAANGRPSIRTVLLKAIDEHGLVFFTDLRSRKGQDLQARPERVFTKPSGSQSPHQHPGFGQPHPGFRHAGQSVVMHHQSSSTLVPGVGALHHPAFGQYHESVGIGLHGEQVGLFH